jgi:hypothetical protein
VVPCGTIIVPVEDELEGPLLSVEVDTVVVEFGVPLVVTVLVTVASKDAYDRALAEITKAAMTIANARRVKLRVGVALI